LALKLENLLVLVLDKPVCTLELKLVKLLVQTMVNWSLLLV